MEVEAGPVKSVSQRKIFGSGRPVQPRHQQQAKVIATTGRRRTLSDNPTTESGLTWLFFNLYSYHLIQTCSTAEDKLPNTFSQIDN